MATCKEIGTTIIENKIIAEARKIYDPKIIVKSGKHKSNRRVLSDNAICIIDKKLKFLK